MLIYRSSATSDILNAFRNALFDDDFVAGLSDEWRQSTALKENYEPAGKSFGGYDSPLHIAFTYFASAGS